MHTSINRPFFTIIVPTKNRKKLLKECMDSILRQSFESWELLVVDDDSTDGTKTMVQGIEDSRVKLLKNVGLERSAARNTGIERAMGKYICFMDDDDWVDKDHLKSFFNEIKKESYQENHILRVGFISEYQTKKVNSELYSTAKHKSKLHFIFNHMCGVWSVCIPSAICKQYRFQEQFPHWQDTYFLGELLQEHELKQIPVWTYHYRIHDKMGSREAIQKENIQRRAAINIEAIDHFFNKHKNILPSEFYDEVFPRILGEKYLEYAINALRVGQITLAHNFWKKAPKKLTSLRNLKLSILYLRKRISPF